MKRILVSLIFGFLFCTSCTSQDEDDKQSIPVQKITNGNGKHQAFTDLTFFENHFYLVFRESDSHVFGADGIIKLLRSSDGKNWKVVKEFNVLGVDLRDPKLSINDKKLMLYIHGATYENNKNISSFDYVSYYSNSSWQDLKSVTLNSAGISTTKIQGNEAWPWRITWFNSKAYSAGYNLNGIFNLYVSEDGESFTKKNVIRQRPNVPNEATIRVSSEGEFFMLARTFGSAQLARSKNPELTWEWFGEINIDSFGGPNFLLVKDNKMLISGREGERLILGVYDLESNRFKKLVELPSGGDCSYPGMLIKDKTLMISYYSSHGDKKGSSIYFAKIKLEDLKID
ncbi:sialidase family protein [Flavobacterium sp. TMP13]|uniref:sialidase family protein n=1 Tax=Flavobacterium sp. TMP13 TaxID=3425950 RepID=UPI003D76E32E